MVKKGKYIDGLSPRPSAKRRAVGIDNTVKVSRKAPKRKVRTNKDVVKLSVSEKPVSETPKKKAPVEEVALTEEEVVAAFAGPVESFDPEEHFSSEDTDGRKDIGAGEKKPKKKRKKWSKKRKFFTVFFLLLLAGGVAFYIWGEALIAKLTGGNSNLFDAITAVVTDKTTPLKTDKNGRTNILLMGTSGYDMGGSNHDGAQLTDSIMVISLDQEQKDAALLSLPRDLKVGYTCTATGKVNEVYWCANMDGNDEDGGARALMNEVESILGINLQYYAHMDWGALVQIVDSIGGVTVTLDEDIADYWTNTFIDAGVATTLNGEGALGLARARHGTENGDFSRGASQQKILFAIKDKIIQNGLGVGEMISLINVLGDNLRMNFSVDELKTVAKLLQDFPAENLRQVSLLDTPEGNLMTTATIGGISYVVPAAGVGVYSDIQSYVKKMFSTDPTMREGANILVLNGSGVAGVASSEQKKLKEDGYSVGAVGDAPVGEYTNEYYLYDMSGKKPATKKALQERYSVEALGEGALPAGIYADSYDFVVIIGSKKE